MRKFSLGLGDDIRMFVEYHETNRPILNVILITLKIGTIVRSSTVQRPDKLSVFERGHNVMMDDQVRERKTKWMRNGGAHL